MEEKKFCNTLHKSIAQDAPIPHSIKTDSLSWYLYRGKKAREILVEGERERASESEGKRARSSSRTQKKGEKSTRTFSKLKLQPFTKASLKTRPYHIQSKPTLFPGIFIAERKRAKSWSKGSASERAKVRGSVHAALRAHKRKARKVRVHFQSSNSSVVLYLIFDTCTRARIDTSFFARATSK